MFLSLLFACSACVSCVEIPLDQENQEDQPSDEPVDTSEPADTGEDTADDFEPRS